ncbi:unnamed protein product [Closterium sp. Naga37s-1]|nr:unnamed protein product [Closterium sp. Naga37s-1]
MSRSTSTNFSRHRTLPSSVATGRPTLTRSLFDWKSLRPIAPHPSHPPHPHPIPLNIRPPHPSHPPIPTLPSLPISPIPPIRPIPPPIPPIPLISPILASSPSFPPLPRLPCLPSPTWHSLCQGALIDSPHAAVGCCLTDNRARAHMGLSEQLVRPPLLKSAPPSIVPPHPPCRPISQPAAFALVFSCALLVQSESHAARFCTLLIPPSIHPPHPPCRPISQPAAFALVFSCALLWGIGATAFQSQITALLPLDAAYAHWIAWRSAACSAYFLASPYIATPVKNSLLLAFCLLSVVLAAIAVRIRPPGQAKPCEGV